MNADSSSIRDEDAPKRAPGRIITFYSYKGGTGRTMALANIAWILAMNGRRVLVIDWDFEAPGLHRYYWPFLADPELTETPGLIDFFVHFCEAAHLQARHPAECDSTERPWFFDRTDLTRYSTSLNYEFPNDGVVDFVGAGQQGATYGVRVNTFQWGDFYKNLGGGVFLEAVKARLREDYDFIIIDSRTGISDTSGICTVHMPDELVVCFTLNRQSIYGAAATASSADAQRRRADGTQGLRIWPVPTRIELHEKDRLEASRLFARENFAPFVWHIPSPRRAEYWGSVEMLYFPYYAYEEVLATIADTPQSTASLLNSMERLTGYLTQSTPKPVSMMPALSSTARAELLARYQRAAPLTPAAKQRSVPALIPSRRIYISYAKADEILPVVRKLGRELEARFGPNSVFWDEKVPLGAKWSETLSSELAQADTILVAAGPEWEASSGSRGELERALKFNKAVIPLLVGDTNWNLLPLALQERRGFKLRANTVDDDIRSFANEMAGNVTEESVTERALPVEIDDPQKGQWGGKSEQDDRRLSAHVTEGTKERYDWFNILIVLEGTKARPLQGDVEFHLHPSFYPSVVRVPVVEGRASLEHRAWGAFTVGASADDGRTRLELDLASLSDAPKTFRER